MKKTLCIILSLALCILSGCSLGNDTIRFGAAGIGGMYYTFSNNFTQIASKENENLDFQVKETAGSTANVRLLSGGYIEMGISQMDLVNDAYYGTGDYTGSRKTGYSAVAALYKEPCQIVVLDKSDIHSLDDMQGKTVSIGEEESGTELNALEILKVAGLTENLVKTENYDYTNAVKQLQAGNIDAMFLTAGVQTTIIEELAKKCDIRLISIDEKTAKKLKASYKFYSDYTIPANTYTGQKEDISTLCVRSVLLASNNMSEDTVKELTSILFKNADKLQYSLAINFDLTIEEATDGITIPFHSGAVAYYKEHGKNVE